MRNKCIPSIPNTNKTVPKLLWVNVPHITKTGLLCPWEFLQHRWSSVYLPTFSEPNLTKHSCEALCPSLIWEGLFTDLSPNKRTLSVGFSCLPSAAVKYPFASVNIRLLKNQFSGNKWLLYGSQYLSTDDLYRLYLHWAVHSLLSSF